MSFEEGLENSGRAQASISDIAIVGMAGRFPEADSIHEFYENLRRGRDSVREISHERKIRTSLPLEKDYQICGFIEDIDTFDHAFFGISRGEARNMAPQQRLLLQVAYQAVENAGCDPNSLRGLRGSVYAGDTSLDYYRLAQSFEPTMAMGNAVPAIVGRISRFLGLRGPSAMIDSSSSSSLLALYMAVNDLLLGEVEVALACGVSLTLFPGLKSGEYDIGIRSTDGKTRSFSAEASGTGSGEAVACVVLKTLHQALRDGNPIYAVIKGVAANNAAHRASSLTAPDSEAQAEVIQRAWEKSRIDPRTISFIEAHGTATRLGDPIEIQALDLAFRSVTAQKHFSSLSTVKSNLGHTWSASGIVGLIKAVLSLKHRVLFPSIHSANLSPLIDFANSAVVVTRELTSWEPACGIRRAGVSSFGLVGTNVHAVLEEGPPNEEAPLRAELPSAGYWLPVSARSVTALEANVAALRQWIDGSGDLSLPDIQRTLVCGRGHYAHRFCTTVSNMAELSEALERPHIQTPGVDDTSDAPILTVLLLSGQCDASPELVSVLRREQPHFDMLFAQCEQAAGAGIEAQYMEQFAFQYAFYGLLRHIGLDIRHVVGEGAGKQVAAATVGGIGLSEALHSAGHDSGREAVDIEERVTALFDKLEGHRRILFIEAGPLATISRAILTRGVAGCIVLSLKNRADGFPNFLQDLYLSGAKWQWDLTGGAGRRTELPSYQFQRIRCWMEGARMPTSSETPIPVPVQVEPDGRDNVLEAITAIWKDVLGLDELSPQESFFDLGGDSISGIEVINRVQALFDIKIRQSALLEYETPLALARYVEEAGPAVQPHGGPVPETDDFVASPAQLHVWLASQFEGGSVAFNLSRSVHVVGAIDVDALRNALNALARRHDALRGVFTFIDGQLMQRTQSSQGFTVPFEVRDIGNLLPGDDGTTDIIRDFVSRPFDLGHGPLLRSQFLRFGEDQHIFTYSTHHIIADGWSLEVMDRDLSALYLSYSRGETLVLPPISASHQDRHQRLPGKRTDRSAVSEEYWLTRFDTNIPPLNLPRQPRLGGTPFSGAYRQYRLAESTFERLKKFSRAEAGTVFICALSAFAAQLSEFTEDGTLVLGTSVADRNDQAVEQVVGMLVRTVPLRLQVDSQGSFRALFDHVRSTFSEALRHSDYSYEELVDELQHRGRVRASNLFDVLIEFQQFPGAGRPVQALMGSALQATPIGVNLDTSVFPINIMLSSHSGSLEASIRFDTRLFDVTIIDRLWEGFVRLTEAALEQPDTPLDRLELFSQSDLFRLRTLGHRNLEFDPSIRIHHALERFAAECPGRICLSSGEDECTYADLNARANQLARFFAHRCQVQSEEVVALLMDRSILTVEAILALWKCGAAYLPIDPGYPATFIRTILESSGVRLVAIDRSRMSPDVALDIPSQCQVITVDSGTACNESTADLNIPVSTASLAYVIYTSGSTGVPKGAMVEHLGMLNHLHAKILDLSLSERSTIVQNASSSFDISVWQMFAALFVGGRTVIYEEALQLNPVQFSAQLERDQITVLEVVPSYLDTLLDVWDHSGEPIEFEALEYLLVTGEPALPKTVNRWIGRFPGKIVVNAYGPTEASDDITHHVMTDVVDTDTVPLGRPIPNIFIYVLDENQRLCPPGVTGEICVSGMAVGRGYMNAPALTAKVFLPDPFQPERRMYRTGDVGRWTPEGTLEYFGRTDNQVKVRGFRIELSEIERCLYRSAAVRSAAVITKKDASGAYQLYAYVVLEPGGSVLQCREFVSGALPEHMLPAGFVEVDRLPLMRNGKVDRQALHQRDLPIRQEALIRPRSEVDSLLTEIWEQVLGLNDIGLTDNFFSLGGNSLRAIQVLSRVRSRVGVELDLATLFRHPTISDLTAQITVAKSHADEPIPSLGGAGAYDIALSQNLLLGIEETCSCRDAFNRNDLYLLRGEALDLVRLERSFVRLIAQHESLRTTYETIHEKPAQIVHESGALSLPFRMYDFSQDADAHGAAVQFFENRVRVPFQVATEPLMRADLARVSSDAFLLLVSMHQLISDGRSGEVLLADWLDLYEEADVAWQPGGSRPRLQYKDIARWRNEGMTGPRLSEHQKFWARELEGASSTLPLRTDHVRPPASSFSGAFVRYEFPGDLVAKIAALASEHGVTEFVTAQCAVGLLLAAETGLTDMVVGTYTRGRNRVELENQIGFYVNTVPLRFQVASGDSMQNLLARVQNGDLRAFLHEEYPYEWIMRDLDWHRGWDRTPLFDVMIALDAAGPQAGDQAPRSRHVELEPLDFPRRAKEADLLFSFRRAAHRLEVVLTFNTELFSASSIQRRVANLHKVFEGMVDNRPLSEILSRQ